MKPTKRTFKALMRGMSKAGFTSAFVRSAILPDWWNDDSCADDMSLLPDVEIRVARFLGVPVSRLREGTLLKTPAYPEAQLRRVRDIDRDRLAPAIHAALQIASAVARCLRDAAEASIPANDGLDWRDGILTAGNVVTLEAALADLWGRGIPVVPVDVLPTPSFQGLACIVENRPVIVLGHKHDEPGRVLFLVAHEVGHVAAGDCAPGQPVVDEEQEIVDDDEIELQADRFATRVVVGADATPSVSAASFKDLATRAKELERSTGANASTIIFAWASQTGDYQTATMAVRALYQHRGARQLLRSHFDRHVDLTRAGESDRALLGCVYGDPERDGSPA